MLPYIERITCSIVLYCISCCPLFAQIQTIKFDRISTANGLSHSIVHSITQDKEGFLWFGTREGLNKYDGYSFQIYEHDLADSTTISDNYVRSLCTDHLGQIWAATAKGLSCFNKATGRFAVYLHYPGVANSLSDNDVGAVLADRSGTIWVGTSKGLDKFNPATNGFTNFTYATPANAKPADNTIYSLFEDKSGMIWAGTNEGLAKYDKHSGRFTIYPYPPQAGDSIKNKAVIKAIAEDRDSRLWIGTLGDGLKCFDKTTHTFTVYTQNKADLHAISNNDVFSVLVDSFGFIWVGTRQGLNRFDPHTQHFSAYFFDGREPATISGNSILYLYEDSAKVLWIGTFRGGISKYDLLSKKFTHVKFDPANDNSLHNDFVHALYEDNAGNLWIGHGKGIDQLDRNKTTFTHYTYPLTSLLGTPLNTAYCLMKDKAGNLWIGLSGGGLKKLSPDRRHFTSYVFSVSDSTSLPHNFVNSLHQDKSGKLWIGTRNGLALYNPLEDNFKTYTPAQAQDHPYFIHYMTEDKTGLLWIATANHGLAAFDPVQERFTIHAINSGKPQNPALVNVKVLFEDSKERMWVCPEAGGLQVFDRKTLTFSPVSKSVGLSKIPVIGILEDKSGNLWLSTRKQGIARYNPDTENIHFYDSHDGLQSNEFNMAFWKSKSGHMYFGGSNGFNFFHPDSIRDNTYAPRVAITGFRVFDKPRTIRNNEIVLPYSDNFFSFDFVALSYARTEKNKYAFKLDNFDEDWIQSGTRRYTSYTNLDPGEYLFRVKAANQDGIWNEAGTSVKIIIEPPLWKTPWAYGLYISAFFGLLLCLRQYTINRERLKNNLKLKSLESARFQELDTLKSQFFANISHEFRTPLTLIMSPLEELMTREKNRKEFPLMYRNARRLQQLINQLLDLSRLEAGGMKLETSPADIIAFARLQLAAFDSLAHSKGITLQFTASQPQQWLYIDQDKLDKIITNLLSNALKFTPEQGQISVKLNVSPAPETGWQIVQISISDTGIGIPAGQLDKIFDRFYQVDSSFTREFEGTGIGLSLTRQLVELHRGKISVNSQEKKGTCFIIEIPYQEATRPAESQLAEVEDTLTLQHLQSRFTAELSAATLLLNSSTDEQAPLLLIVEDNADLRKYICKTFEAQYGVMEATNGEEGLSAAISSIPDLIISDLMMPKMDGIRLCTKLKTDERTSHIPVILLTAKATVENKLQGLQKGADDYITKPFHTTELTARVKNLIEGRRKLRERFSRELNLQPTIPAAASPDDRFLQKLIQIIEKNLSDPEFTIEQLEKETDMGHVQLYRKLKALTNQAPGEFLRDFRLKKAALLLTQKKGNVSQVAFEVGFNSVSYFTRSFRQMYNMTPTEFIEQSQKVKQ